MPVFQAQSKAWSKKFKSRRISLVLIIFAVFLMICLVELDGYLRLENPTWYVHVKNIFMLFQ